MILRILTLIFLHKVASYFNKPDIDQASLRRSLFSLEDEIVKIFRESKPSNGSHLLQVFDSYNQQLAQFVSNVHEENSTSDERPFIDKEGPKFLKIKHDNKYLKDKFNWTETDVEEMYYMMGATKVLVWELKHIFQEKGDFSKIMEFTNDDIASLHKIDKENRLNDYIEFTKLQDFKRTDVPARDYTVANYSEVETT